MRTNKELLEIILNNRQLFSTGLCMWLIGLRYTGKISEEEKDYLAKLVIENRPFLCKVYLQGNAGYFWKKGKIEPRIKFLKKYLK